MSSPAGSPFLVALRVRPMVPRYALAPEAFAFAASPQGYLGRERDKKAKPIIKVLNDGKVEVRVPVAHRSTPRELAALRVASLANGVDRPSHRAPALLPAKRARAAVGRRARMLGRTGPIVPDRTGRTEAQRVTDRRRHTRVCMQARADLGSEGGGHAHVLV